mmetsp:Transcript_9551/g.38689  ORF Transcript_9551/g.38689 Transcript_9551/m.38689 type:complete len:178 (-) Transcript_9551:3594-4127(-)
MAMMYQQFQQFQQYQAFAQMMQQQQVMMLGWAGQQQAQVQAPPNISGTVFGGVGPRASFNGSISEGGSFGTFGSGAPSVSVNDAKRRVSKRAAAAHGKKAAMKRAFVALKAIASAEKAARRAAAKAARREAKDAKRAARAARRAAEEAETRRLVKEQALRELRAQLQQPAQAAALTA